MKKLANKGNQQQQGNILVLFCVGLLAMLGTASMALDGGHILLNKSRVQLLVDSAALSGATEIMQGGNHDDARQAVVDILSENLNHTAFKEIAAELDLSAADNLSNAVTQHLTVDFSHRPDPFTATSDATAQYVRVSVDDLPLNSFLAQVLGIAKQVGAAAVAGPSTALVECYNNLTPFVVCGANDDPADNYGLPVNQLQLLKITSNTSSPIGPGNFQLIRLPGAVGADDIRKALAGMDYMGELCFTPGDGEEEGSQDIPTEPGNTVGPVVQGLNTRMGMWQGAGLNEIEHPRDLNVCEGEHIPLTAEDEIDVNSPEYANAYRYSGYKTDTQNANESAALCNVGYNGDIEAPDPARFGRRVLTVLVGNCDGKNSGATEIGHRGAACFFLTQAVKQKGNEAYVIGEYLEACNSEGVPSGEAMDLPGQYKIVLYHAGRSDA